MQHRCAVNQVCLFVNDSFLEMAELKRNKIKSDNVLTYQNIPWLLMKSAFLHTPRYLIFDCSQIYHVWQDVWPTCEPTCLTRLTSLIGLPVSDKTKKEKKEGRKEGRRRNGKKSVIG